MKMVGFEVANLQRPFLYPFFLQFNFEFEARKAYGADPLCRVF
jgi:hypothetical protein